MFGTLRSAICEPGQERVDTHDIYRDTTLDLPRQYSFHWLIGLMSLPNLLPNTQEVSLLLRKHDDPVIVLKTLQKNLYFLARFDPIAVLKLIERDRSLALEAEFQDNQAVGNPEYLRMDDLAFPEVAHHIRVIGEKGLEVRGGYVENFLPVWIRQQLGGDAARSFLGHGYSRVLFRFILGDCLGFAGFGFALGGGFGGGVRG